MSADRRHSSGTAQRSAAALALRALVAVALLVDAVVHLRLATGYQASAPGGVGAGTLFRVEAVAALVAAVWVLSRGSRSANLAALVVGVSAVAAVVLYRYVDIPAFGPLPAMYEPVWYAQKTLSAQGAPVAPWKAALFSLPPATYSISPTLLFALLLTGGLVLLFATGGLVYLAWRPAAVRADSGHYQVEVQNPSSGYATLRARATDAAGNSVEQTVVRAFAIGS